MLTQVHHFLGLFESVLPRSRKYQLPPDLAPLVEQLKYERWLDRKANAHVKRDRKRGNSSATGSEYKAAIHKAVSLSGGLDAYTGEKLDWSLLSQYNNENSKAQGRLYKKKFALLPTVDHVDDGLGPANFKICAWRTNDAKNDLSHEELIELSKKIIGYWEMSKA